MEGRRKILRVVDPVDSFPWFAGKKMWDESSPWRAMRILWWRVVVAVHGIDSLGASVRNLVLLWGDEKSSRGFVIVNLEAEEDRRSHSSRKC